MEGVNRESLSQNISSGSGLAVTKSYSVDFGFPNRGSTYPGSSICAKLACDSTKVCIKTANAVTLILINNYS